MQDPLYQKILSALEELPRDKGDQFAECVCDLLQDDHPGIVHVAGGRDAGVDGAIPTPDGLPTPLVCTIGEDVIGNMTKNLDSHRREYPTANQVVVATSQSLTPQRRRNLEKRARDKRFTLRQIYDQENVAKLLYRDPTWRRELLGIGGHQPALSVFPLNSRLDEGPKLQGRDQDVAWLDGVQGDAVVVGQPGSGKSYLLQRMAADGWGLFAASEDVTSLLDAWRELEPPRIIVDDAHSKPGLLEKLVAARRETGMSFDIVATTWPGSEKKIAAELGGVPNSQLRELELLTRDEILSIYKELGLEADSPTMTWLVDQAANKPGLAVLLGRAAVDGKWNSVVQGEELREYVVRSFLELTGIDETNILAAIALGGSRGMTMTSVADGLRSSLDNIRRSCVGLAAGGVLDDARDGAFVVIPRPLRLNLIARTFLSGSAADLQIEEFFERVVDRPSSVWELVDASLLPHTVIVPEVLRDLVRRYPSPSALRGMASNPRHLRWVLDEFPDDLLEFVGVALHTQPSLVIRKLLALTEEARPSESPWTSPDRPFSFLSGWIEDLDEPAKAISNRKLLVREAKGYLSEGGDLAIAQRAMLLALSPRLEASVLDAGAGTLLRLRRGILPPSQLEALPSVWSEIVGHFETFSPGSWLRFRSCLIGLIHPVVGSGEAEESLAALRELARTMLTDLWARPNYGHSLRVGLRRLARIAELELPRESESSFDVLFPETAPTREERAEQDQRVKRMALAWVARTPLEFVWELNHLEAEAKAIGIRWPGRASLLAEELAIKAAFPEKWLSVLLDAELDGNLIEPFLRRTLAERSPSWEELIERTFDIDSLSHVAVRCGLREKSLGPHLERRVLAGVGQDLHTLNILALRNEVPQSRLKTLFEHEDPAVVLAAAVGEWCAEPTSSVRSTLESSWRLAILRTSTWEGDNQGERIQPFNYWLAQIFATNPTLSFDWLLTQLDSLPLWIDEGSPFATAVKSLEPQQRRELIARLPAHPVLRYLAPVIVDGDPVAFESWLQSPNTVEFRLRPLLGRRDDSWDLLAPVALNRKYSATEVAEATVSTGQEVLPRGGEHWSRWVISFERRLEEDPTGALAPVFREIIRLAKEREETARTNKRAFELSRRA